MASKFNVGSLLPTSTPTSYLYIFCHAFKVLFDFHTNFK